VQHHFYIFIVLTFLSWNLSMKQGSLIVCLYLWDPLNRDASDGVLGLFGKFSRRRGALAWFHGVWTCGVKVFEYWMISSLKVKLNPSWKFRRNWNVPLCCWKDLYDQILMDLFGKIWIQKMWEILIFKWFLLLKIQIKFQKPGFWRKNWLNM